MYRHPRSVVDRVFTIWPGNGRFTKNPDMVRLPEGPDEPVALMASPSLRFRVVSLSVLPRMENDLAALIAGPSFHRLLNIGERKRVGDHLVE